MLKKFVLAYILVFYFGFNAFLFLHMFKILISFKQFQLVHSYNSKNIMIFTYFHPSLLSSHPLSLSSFLTYFKFMLQSKGLILHQINLTSKSKAKKKPILVGHSEHKIKLHPFKF